MSTVKELLDKKGRSVLSVEASVSIRQVVTMLAEKNIGALMLCSAGSRLVGILSERDCARKVILNNLSYDDTPVSEIMTADVIVAHEDTLLDSCMALMIQHGIRHLPIVDHETPVGMITLGDITKMIIREQSETIEELESVVFEDQGGES